jgi:beta-N-acetylhexosaminidase
MKSLLGQNAAYKHRSGLRAGKSDRGRGEGLTVSTSIERLADRCIFPGFVGTTAPDWARRRVADGLGGVVLYSRNIETPEQLAALNAALHAERPQLLVAVDEEGGNVTRLEARTGSSYPGNLALGAAGDVELTRAVAMAMGADLAYAGVDLDLAPDADVNSNPVNPVIGVRSFGSEPEMVAAHTRAWVGGLQAAGVAACAKHFPGHGDTDRDSHLELPLAGDPRESGALEPFRSAIAAGVQVVMSAHIWVPSLDGVPATISRRIMGDLLRDELGFGGLVITDGLEMRGLSDELGVADSAVRALVAGCDALCIGGGLAGEDTVEEVRSAIIAAVADGRLGEDRLADAASRVDALAAWRSLQSLPPVAGRGVGLIAARQALRAEGPVRIADDALLVHMSGQQRSIAAGAVPWGLCGPLSDRGANITSLEVEQHTIEIESILHQAKGRSLVLEVTDLHRHLWQALAVQSILRSRPEAVVIEMGLPAYPPAGVCAYIRTYGASRVSAIAAAEVMKP